jgi:hypothetical protein
MVKYEKLMAFAPLITLEIPPPTQKIIMTTYYLTGNKKTDLKFFNTRISSLLQDIRLVERMDHLSTSEKTFQLSEIYKLIEDCRSQVEKLNYQT